MIIFLKKQLNRFKYPSLSALLTAFSLKVGYFIDLSSSWLASSGMTGKTSEMLAKVMRWLTEKGITEKLYQFGTKIASWLPDNVIAYVTAFGKGLWNNITHYLRTNLSNQTTAIITGAVFLGTTLLVVTNEAREYFKITALDHFSRRLKQKNIEPGAQPLTEDEIAVFNIGKDADKSLLNRLKSCFNLKAILNPTAYYAGLKFASLPQSLAKSIAYINLMKKNVAFSNLVVAGPDMISFVPQDLWPQIIKNLSNVTDFFRLKQVSKSFSTLSHALIPGIDDLPVDWQKGKGNLETKIASFEKECKRISCSHEQYIIDRMGGIGFLAAIPLLEFTFPPRPEIFGKNEYVEKVYEMVKNNWESKECTFPYGTIFVKNIETNTIKKVKFETSVAESFPPLVNWYFDTFKSDKLPDGTQRTDYMKRLANNRPCGEVVQGKETLPKKAKNGKSLIQLCDEKGNTLNFCTHNKKSL